MVASLADVGSKVWYAAASIASVHPVILLIIFVFLLAGAAEGACRMMDRVEAARHKAKAASTAAQ